MRGSISTGRCARLSLGISETATGIKEDKKKWNTDTSMFFKCNHPPMSYFALLTHAQTRMSIISGPSCAGGVLAQTRKTKTAVFTLAHVPDLEEFQVLLSTVVQFTSVIPLHSTGLGCGLH